VCAEFALLRLWNTNPNGRCVYIAPYKEVVEERYHDWRSKFNSFKRDIVMLTGETTADLKVIQI